jgi:hypothetical protein
LRFKKNTYLYFKKRDAIVKAVAIKGFHKLTIALGDPEQPLADLRTTLRNAVMLVVNDLIFYRKNA